MGESLICSIVKFLSFLVCRMPVGLALGLGRFMGRVGYLVNVRHKSIAYSNLKIAFSRSKKPDEIKQLVKDLYQNFGQNFIEILRLPVLAKEHPEKYVRLEGKEHVQEALKKNKGVILLAMHFGSWEIANLIGKMIKHPYCVIANPQKKFSKLDDLLNDYRQQAGSQVIARGRGTREIIESLQRNDMIGMVVDQGGKTGAPVKFFGRQASMSIGALKLSLKYETPICFAVIHREEGPMHKIIFTPALEIVKTDDPDKDISVNLEKISRMMEHYIAEYPSEYMWFYKIWKYSKETTTVILNDGKTGHLRQSQAVAGVLAQALKDRGIRTRIQTIDVQFKNDTSSKLLNGLAFLSHPKMSQGRLKYLKWFLTKRSFEDIVSVKADYCISCGSSIAGANFLLSRDNLAKSVCVLKPGIFGFRRFDLVLLPEHDNLKNRKLPGKVALIKGSPNLINEDYLKENSKLLCDRYVQLKERKRSRIGLLLGGDTKRYMLNKGQVKAVINQIKEAAQNINADIMVTTSRRTSEPVEQAVIRDLKHFPLTKLTIIASLNNVPESVGGILGLSDILIVSGDSISMVTEAATAGKNVIVFPAQKIKDAHKKSKHDIFIERMHAQGYIVLANEHAIGQVINDMARNKIRTKPIDNRGPILEAMRLLI